MDNYSSILCLQSYSHLLLKMDQNMRTAGQKPEMSQKSTVLKKKMPTKKKAKTTKPTVASASCPTKTPSFSRNKRIHATSFPESEAPMRPQKIMKPEETKE